MRLSKQDHGLWPLLLVGFLTQTVPGKAAALVVDSDALDILSPDISATQSTATDLIVFPSSQNSFNESIISDVGLYKRDDDDEFADCTGLIPNLGKVKDWFCCFSCCFPSERDRRAGLPPGFRDQRAQCRKTGRVPSLDEVRAAVDIWNQVATKTSIFYAGNGSPPKGIKTIQDSIRCWWNQFRPDGLTPEATVSFDNIVPDKYAKGIGNAFYDYQKKIDPTFGPFSANDRFGKLCSQAFAERAQGIVYIFMPHQKDATGLDFDGYNVWRLWEYPALTRNPAVTEIRRADPKADRDGNYLYGTVTTFWRQGDPVSPNEPLGTNWPPGMI